MSCEASDTEVILQTFQLRGRNWPNLEPQPIQSGKNLAAGPRMLRSTDSTRLPMLSELSSTAGETVTCLLLANHGEVATAEDATSVNRAEQVGLKRCGMKLWPAMRIAAWDCCSRRRLTTLTAADPSLALALQQYSKIDLSPKPKSSRTERGHGIECDKTLLKSSPCWRCKISIRVQTTWVDPAELLNDPEAIALIEILGRKVQILSLYAPAQFHDMRKKWAVAAGRGEDFPEFNPNTVLDWREVTRKINEVPLLLGICVTAVSSHMDGPSWLAFVDGGVVDGREFSSPRLATIEEFSGLGDPEKVALWEEAIDSLMTSVESDDRIDFRRAREVMGQLLDTNTRSVQIPTPALVKEVGDAALTSLDDYTGFIWPDEVRRFQQNTEGNFVGIGVQIRKAEDGGIFVVAC